MELKALVAIKRIELLIGLIKTDRISLFEKTLKDYLCDNGLENSERSSYEEMLNRWKTNNKASMEELLYAFKANNLSKIFENPCEKNWSSLIPTNNNDTKFCPDCKRNVFKVYNKQDYRKRKQLNQCVAIGFHLTEKFTESTGCDLTVIEDCILLGSPVIIDNE